MINSTYKEGVD